MHWQRYALYQSQKAWIDFDVENEIYLNFGEDPYICIGGGMHSTYLNKLWMDFREILYAVRYYAREKSYSFLLNILTD